MATMRAMNDSGTIDGRARQGLDWARRSLGRPQLALTPLAGDASFRRYFRLRDAGLQWVLMDAPPSQEDSRPFVDVAARLNAAGIHAPRIEQADLGTGFLVLEDLGDDLLRDALNTDTVDRWFPPLFDLLARLARDVGAEGLPPFGRDQVQQELDLFTDWYLARHKGLALDSEALECWTALCDTLLANAMEEPQVFVHRDFHSCNLLLAPEGDIGVIDFQDAVRGPLSYDFASLVWDRYIAWPRERIEAWTEQFRQSVCPGTAPADWQRQVDWTGLQRNLKIVGIFARLHYRDGRSGYLDLVPRFWGYVRDVLGRYPQFEDFDQQLERLSCAP